MGYSAYSRYNLRYAQSAKTGPWKVVFVLALIVLLASLSILGYLGFTYWNGQKAYDDVSGEYFQEGSTLSDFDVDWDALQEINPDVVGWIYVPGTDVNYPIVHRDGDDSYYLNHNFNDSTAGSFGAEYGCIMLSGENAGDFADELNIVYGHHMSNGKMFAPFANFVDSKVFNEHRTVYILTPQGNFRLNTIAVDRIAGTDGTIVVPNFASDDKMAEYVRKRLDDSLVTPDPAVDDASDISQLFAFSTCDSPDASYRIITFAEVVEYLPEGAAESQKNSLFAGDEPASADSTVASDEEDVSSVDGEAKKRASSNG